MSANSTTVILTHGAWADGSSWGKVILQLERRGLRVIAAPIPLTSLTDDVCALRRAIEGTSGPVILAAHAYAGGVISAVKHERVKSLIYVAALAPDKGETVGDVFYRGKPHPKAPQLAPDPNGLIWMPEQGFGDAFAQNASADTLAILAATQRPIALPCIQEPSPEPAWKTKPAWFLVAEEDRMISPQTQHFMAGLRARKRDPARSITHRWSRRRIRSWISFWTPQPSRQADHSPRSPARAAFAQRRRSPARAAFAKLGKSNLARRLA